MIWVTSVVCAAHTTTTAPENPRRNVCVTATTDHQGRRVSPHPEPLPPVFKGRCSTLGRYPVEDSRRKPRTARVGHVGQAYLEAVERQRHRAAEGIRRVAATTNPRNPQ